MKKISVIFGTRPEAIKLAPVIRALQARTDVRCSVCVTGQHKEMLDQVLDVFHIVPDVRLAVMQHSQTLSGLTARLLDGIDSYLTTVQPDFVLAQGDTTTAFVAALASFYAKVPFGHIEAGLRTHDLYAPWPEEGNRIMTTKISTLHFAPTAQAVATLRAEGVSESNVFLTGNTIVDALTSVVTRLPEYQTLIESVLPSALYAGTNRVVLITGHRRESFDGGLERVCIAVQRLADQFPETQFVYPVHLNPKVQQAVTETLGTVARKNVHLLPPLNYIPFVWLMRRAHFIVTDSGGIQEEAPTLGKPVLVTRTVTERPEGVQSGNAVLVGSDTERIIAAGTRLLTDAAFYDSMAHAANPYGDGTASERIADITTQFLNTH